MAVALQFGRRDPGVDYPERPTAFGLVFHDQKLACVRVERARSYYDLPGGAVDGDEDEHAALIREFGEETGLVVEVGARVIEVSQPFLKSDGQPVCNNGGIYVVRVTGERPELKVEDDHTLVWLDPRDAVVALRHDAHAWAVAAWLRRG